MEKIFKTPLWFLASLRLWIVLRRGITSPAAWLLLGALAARAAVAPVPFSKEVMLQNIATNLLAADWQETALRCRRLTNYLAELTATPSEQTLKQARNAWLEAADIICRLRCFQAGPLADRDCAGTFYYWQVLGPRIEGLISSTEPVDQAVVDRLGSTTKGLFALEYLLFDGAKTPTALELLSGTNSSRRCACLLALGSDLELKASLVAGDWAVAAKQGAAAKFVAGGQQTINLVVNQLAAVIEHEAERHLKFVLELRPPVSRQLYRIERARSASSLQGVIAALEGARRLYQGGAGPGMDNAVNHLNEALEKRLEEHFEAVIAATRAIGVPLEEAAVNNRAAIETAYERVHKLEILIKVDLASALGVTLTFSSNDGD